MREIQIVGGWVTAPPTFEFSPPGAPPGRPRGGPRRPPGGKGGEGEQKKQFFVKISHFSLETGHSEAGIGNLVSKSSIFHI